MKLNGIAEKLRESDVKASRVKAVESELGLSTQKRLPPEQTALYKAVFKKLKGLSQQGAGSQTMESQPGLPAGMPTELPPTE